ncbi:MAG: hypothetical protein N3B18_05885 [Desulfobacterota bacterium]|nr:hypothetical protein [Thermodesulfobacteriota bacterium]
MLTAFAGQSSGKSYLCFLESQFVGGYDTTEHETVLYSMNHYDAMQKPSVGFDYIQRLSGAMGDWGALALQARLAYNDEHHRTGLDQYQIQLYNAYVKYKARSADLWIGHNRIAFGLGSYLDSHGLLLQPLTMYGYGYDRDWGIGATRDFSRGSFSVTCTTGTGMPLSFNGNYFVAGRGSYGVLAQDNYTVGISFAYGKPLETIGYKKMMTDPKKTFLVGCDIAYFWNNLEMRVEAGAGENRDEESYAILGRFGLLLYDEERMKIEAQPVYWKRGSERSYELAGGATWKLNTHTTLRSMYIYDAFKNGNRIVLQVYWYYNLL